MQRTPHALRLVALTLALLANGWLLSSAAQAATYTWTGATDSDFNTASNWGGNGVALTGGTSDSRITVQNNANHPLIYSILQGHTIYATGDRALFLGTGGSNSGAMTITGGIFESQATAQDGITNSSGSSSLTIAGGSYVNTNNLAGARTFLVIFSGGGTGTLNVNSGNFAVTTLRYGEAAGSTGTGNVNLNGGTLSVGSVVDSGNAVSNFNFNGGTLQARGDNSTFMQGLNAATVQAGGAVIDTNGFNVTIGQALLNGGGGGGMTKNGAGALTLSGANAYTGGTNVNAGTLALGANNVLANAAAVNVDGGTFDVATFNDTVGAVTLTSGNITGTTGVLTGSAYNVQSGTVSAILGGPGALTKTTAGTVILSGANTYTGVTNVNAGVLEISHNSALGSAAGGTTVANPARVVLNDGVTVASESISITGDGTNFSGSLQANAGANATWNGNVTLNANARVGAADGGVLNLGGVIQNGASTSLNFSSFGSGAVVVSGANTYTGSTSIIRGVLRLGANDSLPANTILDVDSSTASENSTFDLNGFNQTVGRLQRSGFASGGGSFVTNSGGTVKTLTINQSAASTYNGIISGNLELTKTNSGTLTLSGANTYTGGTNVNAGTLALGANNVLANSGAVNVVGGTFDIATFNDTVGAVTLTSGNITGTTGVLTGSSYSVQSGTVSAILGGAANLTKTTAGTVILSGANTYTGTTTISGGTLTLQHDNALGAAASPVAIASATLRLDGGIVIGRPLNAGTAGNGSTTSTLENLSGNNTWNGAITKGDVLDLKSTAGLLTINGKIDGSANSVRLKGAGDGVINGKIESAHAIQKSDAGTWTLNNENPFTVGAGGNAAINAGTLLVNNPTGSGLGNANVVVANNATLGGTGSFTGSLTVNSGGTLSPGMSAGTLSGGSLAMQTGSNFVIEIGGLTAGDGFGFYDQYIANGSVNLASGGGIGATLQVSLTTPLTSAANGAQFVILDQFPAGAVTGTFAYDGASLLEGDSFVVDTWNRFTISYVGGSGANDVVLTYSAVVPEPSTVVLLGLGLVGVMVFARRRRREPGQLNG